MFNLQQYAYFEDLNLGLTKYTPIHKKILDVACGQGLLGEAYRKNGNVVIGIDRSTDVKSVNKKRLDTFYNEDITHYQKIQKLLGKNLFDVIVFADILEHVYDPITVVTFYKNFLKKNGMIYISVPNFVVWYTRLEILFGNFFYTEAGTQEKTHIRMFTKNNVKRFAQEVGLTIETIDITPGIARFFVVHLRKFFFKPSERATFDRSAIMKSPVYAFYTKYLYPLEYAICTLLPGLLAFQYIVILKKSGKGKQN